MFLVTGATGTVGRFLVEHLLAAGASVRAVTRAPRSAGLPDGAEVVAGDPSRPAGMDAALVGAEALFLHPRAVGEGAAELVERAKVQGVRRVVALSAADVDDDPARQPSRYCGDRNKEAEDAAVGSGLEWTSLRPSFFAGNALAAWGGQLRRSDELRFVHAAFEESPIDEYDLAAVAAQALLTDRLVGTKPLLTGPESLSHERMVQLIGAATGRRLRFVEVSPAAGRECMVRYGIPAPFVDALLARYDRHAARPQYPPTGEVERILGRPARTFAQWAVDLAPAFVCAA